MPLKKQKTKLDKKKAQLWFLAKFIIGAIVLIMLIFVIWKIFSIAMDSNDKRRAQESISQIKMAMENAKSEGKTRYMLLNPKGWNLLSYNDPVLNSFCDYGKCICMCSTANIATASPKDMLTCLGTKEGICETVNSPIKNNLNQDLNKEIKNIPYPITIVYSKDEDVFRFYNFDIFNFKEDFMDPTEFYGGMVKIGDDGYQPVWAEYYPLHDHVAMRNQILQRYPQSRSLLIWQFDNTYTSFTEKVVETSTKYEVNPYLTLVILQIEHNLIGQFQDKEDPSKKIIAAKELLNSVKERAKSRLDEKTFNELCNSNSQETPKDDPKEAFNQEIQNSIACLSSTLKKGVTYNYSTLPEYQKFKYSSSKSIYWYIQNMENYKKVWEEYQMYTK